MWGPLPLPPASPSFPPCSSATSDPGPLNRAEWIKFVAAFFNKEAQANTLFANIVASYQNLQQVGGRRGDEDCRDLSLGVWGV